MARAKPKREWVERTDRRAVQMRAFAILDGAEPTDVTLSDLSYDGCQIESEHRFAPGEKVELRVVRLGAIEAEVCWAYDGRAGARFVGGV